jgi:hypothetical protein
MKQRVLNALILGATLAFALFGASVGPPWP